MIAYLSQLYGPMKTISQKAAGLQSAMAGAQRALELLDEVPDVAERPGARALKRAAGHVELRQVSFGYSPESTILHDVSFSVAPGMRVGIAGRTGAGKSTLISLITRFYDPCEGVVLLDGVDLRDYRLEDLRSQFAIVLQEPVLFSTTIAENIAYGRSQADMAEIVRAAEAAEAHAFISALPDGYQTQVGERGMRLSGGERQRLSLARAFLKDAPILILDEPTSSVDTKTETSIMYAMERLMQGRTTFMIAHRLGTLEHADLLLVVDDGRVVPGRLDQLAIPDAGAASPADGTRRVSAVSQSAQWRTTTMSLRIVVTGLAATYPFGGVFWDYVQYVLGLARLGHDVLYVEDTGRWCYDPAAQTFVADGSRNAARLAAAMAALSPGLADRWFYRDAAEHTFGRPWPDVVAFCRTADLFLHISASCLPRDEYFAARRRVFIDSDPMYTQASVPGYVEGTLDDAGRSRVEMLRCHDRFFTFGERVGEPGCRIPTELFDWIPTRQPVVLDCFRDAAVPVAARRRVLTTVASWEPTEKGPVVRGVAYSGKSVEFERFVGMPAASRLPLEIALSGPAPVERLRTAGWMLRDGFEVSADPWTYRAYLARSLGEWSVAKNAYVASRSGWFSCRTACYLALGVPAIVQDTGVRDLFPTGRGLFVFTDREEAQEAIEQVEADPARHADAARAIASEYFDSDRVLTALLDAALAA